MSSSALMPRPAEISGCPDDQSQLRLARQVVAAAFGTPGQRPFAVQYWSGDRDECDLRQAPRFTLVIRHPAALRSGLLPPSELALGEAFISGELDVEGDLEEAAGLVDLLRANVRTPGGFARLTAMLLRLSRATSPACQHGATERPRRLWGLRHSRRRDAAAIRHHYDVGNAFYQLWLDPQMVYSCAYYPPGVGDLAQAQQAKLDYICRKLHLRRGERLLDIGCGWGALVRHAARHYDVEAVGITLSPAQAELATRRIAEEGLEGRCRVEVRDYRDLPRVPAFDKVASVGMFEHVGQSRLREYFGAAYRVLRPGGLLLNHGIIDLEDTRPPGLVVRFRRRLLRQGEFIRRYVFPDGELVPLARVVAVAEGVGFETRDVESLREHYVLTLRGWGRRLEARERDAVALVGAATFRIWRLYMAVSAHSFETGRIGVVQHLLAKPGGHSAQPCTRHHWYLNPRPAVLEACGV